VDLDYQVGKSEKHGRTAHVKGPSKGFTMFAKIAQAIGKAVVIFFTGGAGGKAFDALLDVTHTNVSKMNAGEQAKWFNDASNPEMYVWALSIARKNIMETYEYVIDPKNKHNKEAQFNKALYDILGVKPTDFDNIRTAMIPGLKLNLWFYYKNGQAQAVHALQSILILFYGGIAETWPLIEAAYKNRLKVDWKKRESAPAAAGWIDALVKALEPYRKVAEGADNPALDYD
jgi:hypothetical protein